MKYARVRSPDGTVHSVPAWLPEKVHSEGFQTYGNVDITADWEVLLWSQDFAYLVWVDIFFAEKSFLSPTHQQLPKFATSDIGEVAKKPEVETTPTPNRPLVVRATRWIRNLFPASTTAAKPQGGPMADTKYGFFFGDTKPTENFNPNNPTAIVGVKHLTIAEFEDMKASDPDALKGNWFVWDTDGDEWVAKNESADLPDDVRAAWSNMQAELVHNAPPAPPPRNTPPSGDGDDDNDGGGTIHVQNDGDGDVIVTFGGGGWPEGGIRGQVRDRGAGPAAHRVSGWLHGMRHGCLTLIVALAALVLVAVLAVWALTGGLKLDLSMGYHRPQTAPAACWFCSSEQPAPAATPKGATSVDPSTSPAATSAHGNPVHAPVHHYGGGLVSVDVLGGKQCFQLEAHHSGSCPASGKGWCFNGTMMASIEEPSLDVIGQCLMANLPHPACGKFAPATCP